VFGLAAVRSPTGIIGRGEDDGGSRG